ncbi:hypothetical protein D3C81_1379190 [compost metagenome]
MIELGIQLLFVTNLRAGQPFRAEAVDAVDAVTGPEVEGAIATHVVGQIEADPQVIGAAALAPSTDYQCVVLALVHHAVLHLFEVVEAIQGAHVRVQSPQVQRLANVLANVVADHVVVDF